MQTSDPTLGNFAPADEPVKPRSGLQPGDDYGNTLPDFMALSQHGKLDSLLAPEYGAAMRTVKLPEKLFAFTDRIVFLEGQTFSAHEFLGDVATRTAGCREQGEAHPDLFFEVSSPASVRTHKAASGR
jgi:hypothetical protein